jgi:hypothetical protein
MTVNRTPRSPSGQDVANKTPSAQSYIFPATEKRPEFSQPTTCGCLEGQVGMVVSFVLAALLLWVGPWHSELNGWAKFGIAFGISCVGGSLGKIIGMYRAARRLKA